LILVGKRKKALWVQYTCTDMPIHYKTRSDIKVALLFIEPRRLLTINYAIESILKYTPVNWQPLYYYHHKTDLIQKDWLEGLSFVETAKRQNRQVIFREMNEKYIGVDQNTIALDVEFWKSLKEDYILLFHADSALCNIATSGAPYPIDFFLHFDYVGAPWDDDPIVAGIQVWTGNGGLALRNRSLTIYCLEHSGSLDNFPPFHPEDYYYAYCAQRFGRAAPPYLSQFFALETHIPPTTLGIHGVCLYANNYGCQKEWVDMWLKKCPESLFLFTGKNGTCSTCRGDKFEKQLSR